MSRNAARRASATLKIASDRYAPEEISSFIGLKPDDSLRVGEVPRPEATPKGSHGWVIKSDAAPSAPLEAHIERLIERIGHAVPRLRTLGSECTITVLGSAHTDSPLLVDLEPHLVAAIDEIPAILGIDIYAIQGDERARTTESGLSRTFQKTRVDLISIGRPDVEPPVTAKWFSGSKQAARAIRHLLWWSRSRREKEPHYTNQPSDDADVETHIAHLLRGMSGHKSLPLYPREVRIWCSIFTNTRAILSLEPLLLSRFARIRAGLTIDYFLSTSFSEELGLPISR
jgi:hypothetical protein